MKAKPSERTGHVVLELETPSDTNLLANATPGFIKIQKILVPVDFSGCSRRAVQYALAFARQFKAEVTLLHVVELDYAAIEMSPLDITAIERQVIATVTTRMASFISDLNVADVTVKTHVAAGRVKHEILKEAQEYAPDLIIVGTHGTTGLRHALMGSVAEAVVRHAACPALTVRENEHEIISL